jgi:hypothetical protein
MEQAALCGFKNTPSRSCGCLQAVVSLHQSQKSEGACCNSRSRRDILTKIDCADGALESMSIRIILFVCCNPDKPHQGAARRTDRSFYRPFWKRNRAERRHGRPRSLGCAGRMPGMPPTATEAASGGPVAATGSSQDARGSDCSLGTKGPRIASAFVLSAQRRCAGLLRLGRLVFCRRGINLSNHISKIPHRYSVLSHYVF